jgi:hypothetical protein
MELKKDYESLVTHYINDENVFFIKIVYKIYWKNLIIVLRKYSRRCKRKKYLKNSKIIISLAF